VNISSNARGRVSGHGKMESFGVMVSHRGIWNENIVRIGKCRTWDPGSIIIQTLLYSILFFLILDLQFVKTYFAIASLFFSPRDDRCFYFDIFCEITFANDLSNSSSKTLTGYTGTPIFSDISLANA